MFTGSIKAVTGKKQTKGTIQGAFQGMILVKLYKYIYVYIEATKSEKIAQEINV